MISIFSDKAEWEDRLRLRTMMGLLIFSPQIKLAGVVTGRVVYTQPHHRVKSLST